MQEFFNKYSELRLMVNKAIGKYLEHDYGHKSYEGSWELNITFPDYFEDPTGTSGPEWVSLKLHCYILGPNRHYTWEGTWKQVIEKAKKDIQEWIDEDCLL